MLIQSDASCERVAALVGARWRGDQGIHCSHAVTPVTRPSSRQSSSPANAARRENSTGVATRQPGDEQLRRVLRAWSVTDG